MAMRKSLNLLSRFILIFYVTFSIAFLQGAEKSRIEIDFKKPETIKQWHPLNHISSFKLTPQGLEIGVAGIDPYFAGPPLDLPKAPSWLILRLKSEKGGMGQVFYFRNNATEEDSLLFEIDPGVWQEIELPLPKLGSGYRLRIDPPGNSGLFVIDKIVITEPRNEFVFPQWNPQKFTTLEKPAISAGKLTMHFNTKNPFAYEFKINGRVIGRSIIPIRVGYLYDKELHWLELATENAKVSKRADNISIVITSKDKHSGEWKINTTFRSLKDNVIETTTDVEVNQTRRVVFLPLHLISVGLPDWGTNKTQGLFAGLEYLENEASSSEADVVGPESIRRTPSPHKITFPLMTIVQSNLYLGLIWDNHLDFTAIYDTPDRTFNSGLHIMGVLFPGRENIRGTEGEILLKKGSDIVPGRKITSRAYIIGGTGNTVIPAVQQYVQLKGLPPLPDTGLNFIDYIYLASHGWLKSKCREGNLYRHAYWQGFGLMPAADAAVYEEWLSVFAPQPLSTELEKAAKEAISAVKPENYFHSGVGHIRVPSAPLVYDHLNLAIKTAAQSTRHNLSRINDSGIVVYKPGKVDYGKTHYTNHANGLTAQAVAISLDAAVFSGDGELIKLALERLRALEIYKDGVPRGAQTWEVPLHTPDILASAHLVHAYTIGYKLTGEQQFLERARYWAWTGVPFVYLVNPTRAKVGPYSTIAVFGATNWRMPVWIGLPVQWCGLVYSDALYDLAEIDAINGKIWLQIADGITAAGIQHTWKTNDVDRGGLLPDSYVLKLQKSDGPAINPGTLQINAIRFYKKPPIYDFQTAPASKQIIHAPGKIYIKESKSNSTRFFVETWLKRPYYILVNNIPDNPDILVNGVKLQPTDKATTAPGAEVIGKNLILYVNGNVNVEVHTK